MLLTRLKLFAATLVLMSYSAVAQDSWLVSAKPTIVVRYDDAPNYEFHFTNTSDSIIHGVKLHAIKEDREYSSVIIDTIEPHKTAIVAAAHLEECCSLTGKNYHEATITCDNYSKPIKLAQ